MSEGQTSTRAYRNAEELLPHGELLTDIKGTNRAIRGIYVDSLFYDRQHWWVAHEDGEFIGVKITDSQVSVVTGELKEATKWLSQSEPDDGTLVHTDTVPVEQTPIPYKKEDSLIIECPDCDAFGSCHPWNRDEYVPDTCSLCGYNGDFEVSA